MQPDAALHLLVVPRAHIPDTGCLGPQDLDLVEAMDALGRELLRQRAPPGARTKLGYHVPPWRSVGHLHLHAMALPHTPAWAAAKYSLPGTWLSSRALMRRLRWSWPLLGGAGGGEDGEAV
ncbi:hypothetical protein HYH03_014345 [Edaphochlamys debaryana]|uniref:HIT domain-containing protein n=1 Tax=Edaphochlamys debaryana TaxID=47281 RepID=A0A836BSB6_9CHLO|nr:hypothetical protein HYH03_014345 [Edaphochlamys debaryana]|eukprot:KAG2486972.1 hypothetical protein HYH03_014345 [Edaphochlamys debaryana]